MNVSRLTLKVELYHYAVPQHPDSKAKTLYSLRIVIDSNLYLYSTFHTEMQLKVLLHSKQQKREIGAF